MSDILIRYVTRANVAEWANGDMQVLVAIADRAQAPKGTRFHPSDAFATVTAKVDWHDTTVRELLASLNRDPKKTHIIRRLLGQVVDGSAYVDAEGTPVPLIEARDLKGNTIVPTGDPDKDRGIRYGGFRILPVGPEQGVELLPVDGIKASQRRASRLQLDSIFASESHRSVVTSDHLESPQCGVRKKAKGVPTETVIPVPTNTETVSTIDTTRDGITNHLDPDSGSSSIDSPNSLMLHRAAVKAGVSGPQVLTLPGGAAGGTTGLTGLTSSVEADDDVTDAASSWGANAAPHTPTQGTSPLTHVFEAGASKPDTDGQVDQEQSDRTAVFGTGKSSQEEQPQLLVPAMVPVRPRRTREERELLELSKPKRRKPLLYKAAATREDIARANTISVGNAAMMDVRMDRKVRNTFWHSSVKHTVARFLEGKQRGEWARLGKIDPEVLAVALYPVMMQRDLAGIKAGINAKPITDDEVGFAVYDLVHDFDRMNTDEARTIIAEWTRAVNTEMARYGEEQTA